MAHAALNTVDVVTPTVIPSGSTHLVSAIESARGSVKAGGRDGNMVDSSMPSRYALQYSSVSLASTSWLSHLTKGAKSERPKDLPRYASRMRSKIKGKHQPS